MALEDVHYLKEKNRKRLFHLIHSSYAAGINIATPSKSHALRIYGWLLLSCCCITIYGHIAFIMRNNDSIYVMSQSLCTLFQILIAIIKVTYQMFVENRFYKLVDKLRTHELVEKIDLLANETPYNKELRKDSVKILDQSWNFAEMQIIYYIFAVTSVISYYFFDAIGRNTYNAMKGYSNETILFPCAVVFPFWEDKTNQFPYYHILEFFATGAVYIAGVSAINFDGVFIFTALHGVALIKILKKMIALTTDPCVPKILRMNYLRQCIDHSERIYKYCTEVNDLFLHLSLIQFLLSLFVLGVVLFQAAFGLSSDFTVLFRMILFISAAGFEIISFCLNGQLLTSESETLSNAWYECEWYNESAEFKQLIKFMIMRSNRIIVMRASWFSTMSLPTFVNILRTGGSYFLLLRNLDGK